MAEIHGTVFLVHDNWYLRHLGGGGSMIVINAEVQIFEKLVDGKSVLLLGEIERDHNGCAQQINAIELKSINS